MDSHQYLAFCLLNRLAEQQQTARTVEDRIESSSVAGTSQEISVGENSTENAGNGAAKKSLPSNTLDHAVIRKGQATVQSSPKTKKTEASPSSLSLATGRTPLHDAAKSGYDAVTKVLLARKDINTTVSDGAGMIPLHKAAKYGDLSVVKLLMQRPEISGHERSNEKFGRLPIHMAAKYDRLKVVEYSLAQDEDLVNAVDNDGKSVLHHVLIEDTPQTIGVLSKHKNVKPDLKDKSRKDAALGRDREYDLSSAVSVLRRRSDIDQDPTDSDRRRPKNGRHGAPPPIEHGLKAARDRNDVALNNKSNQAQSSETTTSPSTLASGASAPFPTSVPERGISRTGIHTIRWSLTPSRPCVKIPLPTAHTNTAAGLSPDRSKVLHLLEKASRHTEQSRLRSL